MSAPPAAHPRDPRAEHLALARRHRHQRLTGADLARYHALHLQLVAAQLRPEGVVLSREELDALDARGAVVDRDLPAAIAAGRAWWVTWAPGESPLVCEGSSAEDVLTALAGMVAGDAAHEHPGGAAAWARAEGWEARMLVGIVR